MSEHFNQNFKPEDEFGRQNMIDFVMEVWLIIMRSTNESTLVTDLT